MSLSLEVAHFFKQCLSSAYTLYLFTESDQLLAVLPTLAVSMILAGPTDCYSFAKAFVWLELHLFTFDIKNQIIGVEEDKICKPHRPFPSGRISLEQGERLYLLAIVLCIAASVYNRVLPVSLVFLPAIWLHNEARWAMHPIGKSPLSAVGYMCFSWGTTYIIGRQEPMSSVSIMAILLSGLTFTLTGHAQDFRDRSGDAALGRKTIPIILPQGIARWSLVVMMSVMTYVLTLLWRPPILAFAVFAFIGVVTSVKFVAKHSEEDDRKSLRWYELWLLYAHILPIFKRIAGGEVPLPILFA